jgi:AcrR family transcriptional regulator
VNYPGITKDGGRTLLIRGALTLLNDVHPEDLSIREVARRVDLSSSAPYHHFKTKTDLLAACAAVAWNDLCELLEADGSDEPRERLLNRAMTYLAYARANPGPYRLITSRLFDSAEEFPEIHELRARAMGGVIGTIIAASSPEIDREEAKFLGVSMWSMLHGHLVLNTQPDKLFASHAEFDAAIAHLATRMALLRSDEK